MEKEPDRQPNKRPKKKKGRSKGSAKKKDEVEPKKLGRPPGKEGFHIESYEAIRGKIQGYIGDRVICGGGYRIIRK